MRFTVLRLKSFFTLDLWQTTSASTSKLYVHNTSMGLQNPMFPTPVHCFFQDFLSTQNMVRIIEGKIIEKWSEGKRKWLRVSGRFELSRVRVTEGKITVNVRQKSRGNLVCNTAVFSDDTKNGCADHFLQMKKRWKNMYMKSQEFFFSRAMCQLCVEFLSEDWSCVQVRLGLI